MLFGGGKEGRQGDGAFRSNYSTDDDELGLETPSAHQRNIDGFVGWLRTHRGAGTNDDEEGARAVRQVPSTIARRVAGVYGTRLPLLLVANSQ